jgi:hypothetical protein
MTTLEQALYVIKYCLERYENLITGKDQPFTVKFPIFNSEEDSVILEMIVREYFYCEYQGNGFVVDLMKAKRNVLGAKKRLAEL